MKSKTILSMVLAVVCFAIVGSISAMDLSSLRARFGHAAQQTHQSYGYPEDKSLQLLYLLSNGRVEFVPDPEEPGSFLSRDLERGARTNFATYADISTEELIAKIKESLDSGVNSDLVAYDITGKVTPLMTAIRIYNDTTDPQVRGKMFSVMRLLLENGANHDLTPYETSILELVHRGSEVEDLLLRFGANVQGM